ncbi:hypothetical protein MGU_10078 [Metarhizium guizhouense ARSEF 977]|uniref:Uncharacterized protein n=1 Tax=Metarhizium guizhouense (strain ARSEF 977) TaxID=1276136 RepID=A0A0B4HT05_METGA|nr:hypothetical protein MGU_10078 [Metarhizium guizhouense ARSEF 977]
MHSLAFLATLLIPLAAAAPEVAASPAPEAAGDAVIYDNDNYSGQSKPIPVNGVCQNLGRPFTDRGIRSIRLPEAGEHCNIHYAKKCNGPSYTVYESEPYMHNMKAYSIRCLKSAY